MARTDIAGLLTGVPSGGIDPMAVGGTPEQQRLAFGAQRAQGLQRASRGLMGQDTRTPSEQLQMAMAQLDMSNPDDLRKIAQIQQATGDLAGAAQTAARIKQMQEQVNLSKQQEAERSSLADFLELEYGDKGGRLRSAVMSGAINAGNVDKFIKEEEKDKITFKNVTYTDTAGNTQTQMVGFNEQGQTFSETGQPLVLPDDAQLTITGRTAEDVASNISGFTDKEFRNVRDDIISSRGKLKVLEGITDESIDKYLSFLGKGLAGTGRTLSSFSGLGGDALNDFIKNRTGLDLQEFAGEQGLLFGDLENYFNQKRHDITGAAAAISELKELRKGILSGETSPAVAKAKIAQILQRERDSQEMNFTLLKQGGLDVSGYFDNDATASPALKPDTSNLTVPQQEAKATIDRILQAVKPTEGG
jgi:hypothetical protein